MKGQTMFKFHAELPASITVPLGDTGLSTEVPIKAIAEAHPELIRFAVCNGFIGALNNISRGKDDSGAAFSDAVWAGMRQKKVDTWLQGDWAARAGGGDRATTVLKEAYLDERKAATGATTAALEKSIKATVQDTFGKDEPATFSRFMDAVALLVTRRDRTGADEAADEFKAAVGETRARFEAKYRKLAEEAAAKRAKVKASIDVADLDF
jgi:hypothetical protein